MQNLETAPEVTTDAAVEAPESFEQLVIDWNDPLDVARYVWLANPNELDWR